MSTAGAGIVGPTAVIAEARKDHEGTEQVSAMIRTVEASKEADQILSKSRHGPSKDEGLIDRSNERAGPEDR